MNDVLVFLFLKSTSIRAFYASMPASADTALLPPPLDSPTYPKWCTSQSHSTAIMASAGGAEHSSSRLWIWCAKPLHYTSGKAHGQVGSNCMLRLSRRLAIWLRDETGTGTWRSHVWRHGKDQDRGVATILSRNIVSVVGWLLVHWIWLRIAWRVLPEQR